MFSYVADVSLSEYVKKKRLTLAALELQRGDVRIINVALRYGYECVKLEPTILIGKFCVHWLKHLMSFSARLAGRTLHLCKRDTHS